MSAGDIWSVTCESLWVRSGPGTNYSGVGGLTRGEEVTEKDRGNDKNGSMWIKHSQGWSCSNYMKVVNQFRKVIN